MDLLGPCRSCLQCLSFFHVSPPSPPPHLAAPASSSSPADASGAAPLDPSCASESSPPAYAPPAVQEQDLCPPVKAEDEPVSAKCDEDEALEDVHVTATESEALPVSRIVVAPPVSSPPNSGSPLPEDADNIDKASTLPELPMHGYLPEHSQEHAAHDDKVLPTDRPLDDSQVIRKPHTDAAHHHSHDSTSMDDVENAVAGHATLDGGKHYDKTDDIPLTRPLEVSQSMPHLDMETTDGDASDTNGASALLETDHSKPVVIPVDPHDDDDEAPSELVGRRHQRDRFRDQFKGIKRQIKQGGLHLKQEGSKHMQTIIENMNKQAQQIEQSGSFFMVPRTNNN